MRLIAATAVFATACVAPTTFDSHAPEPDPNHIGVVEAVPMVEPNVKVRAAMAGTLPSPTELALHQDERREQKQARAEWIESMHKAPGVDWRAIDRGHRTALALERYTQMERGATTNSWTEVGSANQAGHSRTACPTADGSTLYVGSANGGVWRSPIDGSDWAPISDALGYESNQVLVVPAGNGHPETVHTLASEGGFAQLHTTTNGGDSWFVPSGLAEDFYEAIRMVRDVSDPRRVYMMTRARDIWDGGGGFDYGFLLYRSQDGGFSWELRHVFPGNPRSDIWIDRQTGGDLYVLSGNTLQVSTDQGLNFSNVGTLPTTGNVSGVILAGSEAGGPSFFAMVQEAGTWKLYQSGAGGTTWSYRHTPGDFWTEMTCSISDPDVVFYGGVECWRSTNGGLNFSVINTWGAYYGDPANQLHADIRGLDSKMVGSNDAIFFNTDGGTYVSYDNGATVQNLCLYGIGISQYYDTYTSGSDPYLVAGGSQDQGYQQSLPGSGTPYLAFDQLISGDYAHMVSTNRDHNLLFSVYPGFILLQKFEDAPQGLANIGDFPTSQHLWLPPLCADPDDEGTFYFLGEAIYKYDKIGTSYHFDITMLPQNFGGATLSGLSISLADTDYWYAVQDDGQIWYSHDHGVTFTNPTRGPNGHWFHGTTVEPSPNDRDLCYIGGSGYLGHPVWKTTDGGATWEGIGDGLPNTLVYELVLGGQNNDQLFAATEVGAYRYDESAGEWESIMGTEAPLTTYWSVEWVPEINSVRFGTFGRGMWDYSLLDPADVVGEGSAQDALAFRIAPNPVRDHFAMQFELAEAGPVKAEVFDIHGRRLDVLADGTFSAGAHDLTVDWNRDLPVGMYLVRVTTESGVAVRKIQTTR